MQEETRGKNSMKYSRIYFSPIHLGASIPAIGFTVILFIHLLIPIFWGPTDTNSIQFTLVNLFLPIIAYALISLCVVCIIGTFKKIKKYKDEGLIMGLIIGFKISLFLALVIGTAGSFGDIGFIMGFSSGFLIGFIIGVTAALSTEFQN